MEIKILPLRKKKVKLSDETKLGFGRIFTDRMFLAEWTPRSGWHDARIKKYEPFLLDPSALVFHYAQEIFEGLKAYKWEDGTVALFRPDMNAKRFNASARRLGMPEVPEELFLDALDKLISLEHEWVPKTPETSLYIRPAMIAVEPTLGVKPSSHYYFFIIASPVGPYYPNGFKPIKVLVEDHYIRASKGGMGEAKTGGNYAGTILATLEAKKLGYDQTLWLDETRTFIEEAGATNMFFVYDGKIVTPSLDVSILHGITRDSLLKLAKSLGLKAEEKKIAIKEVFEEIASGAIVEAFCSGTAAVITPVGQLCYKGKSLQIHRNQVGKVTQKLYDTLTGIQYGKIEDSFGWIKPVMTPILNTI